MKPAFHQSSNQISEKSSESSLASQTALPTDPYSYKPLDTRGQHIRLFKIWWVPELKCLELSIRQFDLGEAPPFRAISYTWGEPPAASCLYVDGKVLKIRKNLWNYFKVFASKHIKNKARFPEEEVWLWADQVCVNQGFHNERNHQVQMMGQIFGQAIEVLVWLGDDKAGEAAITVIRDMNESGEERVLLPGEAWDNKYVGLQHFCNNMYWDRLWIVQEIVLARRLLIFYRGSILDGENFEVFCQRALNFKGTIHNCGLFDLIANKRCKARRDHKAQHLLLDACYATLFSKCEDPRDKIFGLQGLLVHDQKAVIDYTQPAEQVYFDAAMKICSANSFGSEYLVYELAWYTSQIAYGMDLLTIAQANELYVSMSAKMETTKSRDEQLLLLMKMLRERFDGKDKTLIKWNGVIGGEKLGRMTSSWAQS